MKQSLIFVLAGMALLFSSLTLAQPSQEKMMAMKHANPMPNLMRVLKTHPEALNLSDEQKAALKAWHKQSKPKMMELVEIVTELEKQLHDAALDGAPARVLQNISNMMLDARSAIIKLKFACHNRMAQVLGTEKMKKLVDLYKAKS